jgi:hypothetical protein
MAALVEDPNIFLRGVAVSEGGTLWSLKDPVVIVPVIMYFAKDHPLAQEFFTSVHRMHSGGIIGFEMRRSGFLLPVRYRRQHGPKALSLKEVRPIFRLTGSLLPLAALCFLGELIAHRCYGTEG